MQDVSKGQRGGGWKRPGNANDGRDRRIKGGPTESKVTESSRFRIRDQFQGGSMYLRENWSAIPAPGGHRGGGRESYRTILGMGNKGAIWGWTSPELWYSYAPGIGVYYSSA